ncbi:MAG: hypothetical protein KJO35_06355, partial [Gammaproteobacteria bacterium]|nr:hypothetical protein [Gammaproteobacteria bacterium]
MAWVARPFALESEAEPENAPKLSEFVHHESDSRHFPPVRGIFASSPIRRHQIWAKNTESLTAGASQMSGFLQQLEKKRWAG